MTDDALDETDLKEALAQFTPVWERRQTIAERTRDKLAATRPTMEELRHREWKSKTGRVYDKESLRRLLTSPLYVGLVAYQGQLHKGVHESIVPEKVPR